MQTKNQFSEVEIHKTDLDEGARLSRLIEMWEGHRRNLKDAFECGLIRGNELLRQELVRKWLDKGKTVEEMANLLDTSMKEIRRLSKLRPG